MSHRTVFIKFSPAAMQAEIAGLLSAFQALCGHLAGLGDVSIGFLRGEYDASIGLAFATEEARYAGEMDDRYSVVMAQAHPLCAQIGFRVTDDTQTSPAASPLPMKWHKFLIYFLLLLGALIFLIHGLHQVFPRLCREAVCGRLPARHRRVAVGRAGGAGALFPQGAENGRGGLRLHGRTERLYPRHAANARRGA